MAQTILVVDDDPVQRRLLETAIMLAHHSSLWRIARIEAASSEGALHAPLIVDRYEPLYAATVHASLAVSALAWCTLLFVLWKSAQTERKYHGPCGFRPK